MPGFLLDPNDDSYQRTREQLTASPVSLDDQYRILAMQAQIRDIARQTKVHVVGSLICVTCPEHSRRAIEANLSLWLRFMSPTVRYQFVTEAEMEEITRVST